MKRYVIQVDAEAMTSPFRIKAIPTKDGEWVLANDVSKFIELAEHANDSECYCDDSNGGEDPEMCLICKYQEAIAEYRNQT